MSDRAEDVTKEEEPGDEGDEQPSRIAGGCVVVILSVVAVLLLKTIVTVAPYVAYFVAGVLVCIGWQKGRTRLRKQRGEPSEEEQEAAPPDVGEALRRLVGDDNGVLLTRLQRDLQVANTKIVKQLLEAADVQWKAGVRTSHGNGPGVHVKDIPPAPTAIGDPHDDGCCCRSGANANTNTDPGGDGEKGIRVQRTAGGLVIYDLADTHRHRKVGDH